MDFCDFVVLDWFGKDVLFVMMSVICLFVVCVIVVCLLLNFCVGLCYFGSLV